MDLPAIERFVTELLATGEMNDDTRADLERILAEARAGAGHPDDLDYLRALHARVLSAGETEPVETDLREENDGLAELRQDNERLRTELAEARRIIAELEARLGAAG